jgi:hypothetical protein
VGSCQIRNYVNEDIVLCGAFAYILSDDELEIIGISDPETPSPIGFCYLQSPASECAVQNSYAYVREYSGLEIIDISDPANPVAVGFYESEQPYDRGGVGVTGNYAYSSCYLGIEIVNVENPEAPYLAGRYYNMPNGFREIFFDGNLAYVVGFYGLIVLQLGQPTIFGDSRIEPDTLLAYYAQAIDTMTATIHLGDFMGGYAASDVDIPSLAINGTISPVSSAVLPSHPGFFGEVLAIDVILRDLLSAYGTLWDTTTQTYSVSGQFGDGAPLAGNGEFVVIGHRLGDVDGSGCIDIDDVVFLVHHIFANGPAPPLVDIGDVDCSGDIDVDDAVYLINHIFSGTALPGDQDGDGAPEC